MKYIEKWGLRKVWPRHYALKLEIPPLYVYSWMCKTPNVAKVWNRGLRWKTECFDKIKVSLFKRLKVIGIEVTVY